jgi:preprotein translocase subunit SecG
MSLLIGLLSLILVVSSILLCLLILVQLPKKEAGMGAAFGADQAAALFGAGSGSALTSITKWLASIFLILCLVIAVLTAYNTRTTATRVRQLQQDMPAATSSLPSLTAVPAQGGVGDGSAPALTLPESGSSEAPALVLPEPVGAGAE